MAATALTTKRTRKAILLPYQVRWIDDESPMKLGDKSRRTGWTWAEAYDAVRRRFRPTQPRDHDYWFASADESAAFEFIEYCRFFAKDLYGKIADYFVDHVEAPELRKGFATAFCVRCPNGKRITAMTSNPRRFRSKGGDTRNDEAAFHDDPEAMHDAASPATMWGGTYATWSTPNGEMSVFNRFVQNCRKVLMALGHDPNQVHDIAFSAIQKQALAMNLTPVFSYHRVTILDAIEQGLLDKIAGKTGTAIDRDEFLAQLRAKSRGEDGFQQEYMCVASVDASAWLPYPLIMACEHEDVPQPDEPLTGYTGGKCVIGIDVGRVHDLTYAPICEQVGDVLWPRRILSIRNESIPNQFRILESAFREVKVLRFCIDNNGVGVGLADMLIEKYGAERVERVQMSSADKEAIAVSLKMRMEDRKLRLPANNQRVRDGLHKVRKETTATGAARFVAPRDDAGHADEFTGFALGSLAATTPAYVAPNIQLGGRSKYARSEDDE